VKRAIFEPKLFRDHAGTSEIMKEIIGRSLGLDEHHLQLRGPQRVRRRVRAVNEMDQVKVGEMIDG
jgi:hypothetical protein